MKVDTDGRPVPYEEEVSALARVLHDGPPTKEEQDALRAWKQKVIDRFRATCHDTEAQFLEDQDWLDQPVSDQDAFASIVHGDLTDHPGDSDWLYHNYWWGRGKSGNPNDQFLAGALSSGPKDKHGKHDREQLLADPAWQPITTVMRKQPDGSIAADHWYTVGNKAQVGHLSKIVPKNDPTHPLFAPVDDQNPAGLGSEGSDDLVAGHASSTASLLGRLGPNPGHLDPSEWQEIGQRGLKNKNGTIPNNEADFQAAKKRASQGAGGPKVLHGDPTVMHGRDHKKVGFAGPACQHEAGGYLNQGSANTFVGNSCAPLSRVGDGTNDGYVAVVGAEDLFVGGGRTTV